MNVWLWIIALIVVFFLGRWRGLRRVHKTAASQGSKATKELYELASQINFDAAHASDLLRDEAFQSGVQELATVSSYSVDDLLGYADGTNDAIACMAFEALAHRDFALELRTKLLPLLADTSLFGQAFLLRALQKHTPEEESGVIDVVIAIAKDRDPSWLAFSAMVDGLKKDLDPQLENGPPLSFAKQLDSLDSPVVDHLGNLLSKLPARELDGLRQEVIAWQGQHLDQDFLNSIGSV